jgi:hypothetical protein
VETDRLQNSPSGDQFAAATTVQAAAAKFGRSRRSQKSAKKLFQEQVAGQ